MTINSETRVAGPFEGNDSTVIFPFTFKVFNSDELYVVLTIDGVETVLAWEVDYAVTLNPDQNAAPGGTVTLADALATGSTLTLTSDLEALQPLDLTNQGGFYPRVINNAFDRVTILIQQLKAVVSRTLKFPLSDGPVSDLPGRDARAGRVLAFDPDTAEPVAGPTIYEVETVAATNEAIAIVASNIDDVAIVADNINDVTNFADVYYGPSATDPTTRKDGSALQVGDLYFNTDVDRMQVYTGAEWVETISGSISVQNFSGDGVTTEFVLDFAPGDEVVTQVFVGGIYQQKNTYELGGVDGDVLIFSEAPPTGTDNIEVVINSATSIGLTDASSVAYGGETVESALDSRPQSVETVAALSVALPSLSIGFDINTKGCLSAGDGGHGTFDIVVSTSLPVDGYSVVGAPGKYAVLRPTGNEFNTLQFGQNLQLALTRIGFEDGLGLACVGDLEISSPCYYRPQRALTAPGAGSALHFADHVQSVIRGIGNCTIKPTAPVVSMANMLVLQFNTTFSAIAPFYTTVKDIEFDLGGVADNAIYSDFCMHNTFYKIRGYNGTATASTIKYEGYGVANIEECVFGTNIGVDFLLGGGDSRIVHCDFFPTANGKCIRFSKLAGNCSVYSNVFNGEGNAGVIGVDIDGTIDVAEIRDIRIYDNEFSGMNIPVRARKHASTRNVYGVSLWENHITPAAGGAVHTGKLVEFTGIDDSKIHDNYVNSRLGQTLVTGYAVSLTDCVRVNGHDNKYQNLLGGCIYLSGSSNCKWHDEEITDCGRSSAGHVLVDIDTGSNNNVFSDFIINQTSASFAQNTFFERGTANGNAIERPRITGANRPSLLGAESTVVKKTVASAQFSSSGATFTKLSDSYGVTLTGASTGNVTVTLATARKNDRYGISITSDKAFVVDSRTLNSFRVLLYDVGTTTSANTSFTSIEVND
jgi:hypothetical protein